jgi:hypothetical protein
VGAKGVEMTGIRSAIVMAVCLSFSTGALGIRPARAEVTEVWRTPFGAPAQIVVSPLDQSCWMSTEASVTHVAPDGTVLGQNLGLAAASLSLNARDGTVWAADSIRGTVVHLSPDGDVLWSGEFMRPSAVGGNSADDSCWVSTAMGLVHLAADGSVLWSADVEDPYQAWSIVVNPADDSFWTAGSSGVTHYSAALEPLAFVAGSSTYGLDIALDPTDGTCWVAYGPSALIHASPTGEELGSTSVLCCITGIAVDPRDHSCWVTAANYPDDDLPTVLHFSREGDLVWSSEQFYAARCVAVDPVDGSLWLGESRPNQLDHLAADGTLLWSGKGFGRVTSISANTTDDSLWVADRQGEEVVHLSAAGGTLWSSAGAPLADCLSANAADGSCWMADFVGGRVTRLSRDGAELWSGQVLGPMASFCEPAPSLVATNPTDGSCWVLDPTDGRLLHLSAAGEQLWVGAGSFTGAVAVNSHDGSCWVGRATDIVHLSAAGEELWSGPASAYVPIVSSISVNSRDGSVWVGCNYGAGTDGQVLHFAADGRALWMSDWSDSGQAVAVNETDGSCWVSASDCRRGLVLLSVTGEELASAPARCTLGLTAAPDGSAWMSECLTGQVARYVATQAAHNFYLTANTPNPPVVLSGGAASLSAIAVDTPDHGVASWAWSDGGAGGTFSPSASVAAPTYTAPENITGSDLPITLSVTATCAGDPPLTAATTAPLTVRTEFSLRVSMSGLGSVQVNGATQRLPWMDYFQPGTEVNLVAVGSHGYELDRWTGDASGTGTVTLTMDRDYSVGAEFALIPGTAFSFPVDYPEQEFAGWSGWASVPGAGWEWGAPLAGGGQPIGAGGAILGADPGTAHTGDTVVGYVIGGNYQPGMSPQYLTTAPLDFRGRQNVSLHFWRWLAVDDQAYDTAAVEVNVGSGWQRLWTNPTGATPIYTFDEAWTEVEYPLPQADGKTGVQVRWQMGGTDTWGTPTEYGGWSLDDISFECDADRWSVGDASVATTLLWEEEASLSAAISNTGESTWDESFGLQCLAEHTPTGAWGVDFVPISGTVAPTESHAFATDIVAPPVSTIAYPAPMEWPGTGGDATLPCEWALGQEARGALRGEPIAWDMTISRFSDIQPGTEGNWARFYVEELAGAVPEIVRGYGGGIYKPQEPVTRDQLAVYIARATGLDGSGGTGVVFHDVPADFWAVGAIEACADAGIVGGYPDHSFHPTEPVTRAGMCKFIANGRAYVDPSFTIPEIVEAAPFPDVAADHWAAPWIAACQGAGIVQGYPNGNYQPDQGVNRGQMAVFVWRAFLRDRESLVVLGGPTISRYAPATRRYAVGSVTSAEAGETLHASVLLDAVRLTASAVTVRSDLKRVVSEDMFSPAGSFTASLDEAQVYLAHNAAAASGNPYLPLTVTLPTAGLEPGAYLLVTSINGIELARQVHLALTTPTP